MKNINTFLIVALSGIALSLFTGSTKAEVKGGERMLQLNGSITAPAAPGDYKPMSCAKCQDVPTTVRDFTAKGATALVAGGAPTKTVAAHLCEGCVTTKANIGVGKHTKDVVTHKCTSGGAESLTCCNMAK